MAKRRAWLWIIGGIAAAGLLMLVAVAGAGIYFVSRHVDAATTTGADATNAFATVTTRFEKRRPLFDLDDQGQPHQVVPLSSLPTSDTPPSALMIQIWEPDDQKLIRLSLPFWLLRLGPDQMRVSRQERGFDLKRLELDFGELQRIGPSLVLDHRDQDGMRVLLWTE